jgi:hypothetical protein
MDNEQVLTNYVWHPKTGAIFPISMYGEYKKSFKGLGIPKYVPLTRAQLEIVRSATRSVEELKLLEWPDRNWLYNTKRTRKQLKAGIWKDRNHPLRTMQTKLF